MSLEVRLLSWLLVPSLFCVETNYTCSKIPIFLKFQDDAYAIKFLCKCNSALWRSVTCVTFINQCPLLLTLQVLLTWTFNILHPDN